MIASASALSLLVTGLSLVWILPIGTLLGWLLARCRFAGRRLLQALLLLPLVLPPTVTGYYLVWLFGRHGPLGHLPISPMFHWSGAVIAACVVACPLMIQSAQGAFSRVAIELEEASACLGRAPLATFVRVTLPLAWPGLLAGALLSFARALGEFGATLMLAGNIPGRTQTMPLAIYDALLSGKDAAAAQLVWVLTLFSLGVTLAAIWLGQRD